MPNYRDISPANKAVMAQIQALGGFEVLDGLELAELPHSDEFCGFGGVFSVGHPEISAAMLDRKSGKIEASRL